MGDRSPRNPAWLSCRWVCDRLQPAHPPHLSKRPDRPILTSAVAKRRGSSSSGGGGFLIVVLLVVAVFVALLIALAKFIVYVLVVVAVALAFDGYEYGRERLTEWQAPGRFRATRRLLSIVRYPFRFGWRWLRAAAGFPYVEPFRVESIGELLMLTPTEFEEAVAQGLRERGYRHVQHRGGPGDLGVDITCLDPDGVRLAIQCKRYAPGNLVGSREVQLFIGMVTTEHRGARGAYVTTSAFTAPARTLADRHGIRLIDGVELARIFGFEGPPLPERLRPSPASGFDPDRLFYETDEEELVDWEWLSKRLALQGVRLPGEIVRPLDGSGRRGIRFMSTDDADRAAELMGQEAELLDVQSELMEETAQDAERAARDAPIAEAARAERAEADAEMAERRKAWSAAEAATADDDLGVRPPRGRRATNEALLRLLDEHDAKP